MHNKNSTYDFGIFAELCVIIYLVFTGHRILARRYRSKHTKSIFGEIDIIAKRGSDIIFIEVKARRKLTDNYSDNEVLTISQQQRIIAAAKYYITSNKINAANFRFDLIIFKNILNYKHIKNAFSGNLY